MTALTQVRTMLSNLRQPGYPMPDREALIHALSDVEEAMVDASRLMEGREPRRDRTLLAIHDLGGGATPMQVGQKLDPSADNVRGGQLGINRLTSARQAGFVKRAHFGWWVLTDSGHSRVVQILAEGRP